MIRAVVFDLWNTLVRSEHGDPFKHLVRLLDPAQQALFPDMKRDAMGHPHTGAQAFVEEWQERMGLRPEQRTAMVEVFRTALEDADCFPETLAALAATRRLARVALLSNTQSFDMGFLERLGLTALVPVRALSASTGLLKPDPKAFLALQRQLGLFPGEIAMVGDSWTDDVTGAIQAGWTPIWVNRAGRKAPEAPPDWAWIEVPDLSRVPEVIRNLQEGARCDTCTG